MLVRQGREVFGNAGLADTGRFHKGLHRQFTLCIEREEQVETCGIAQGLEPLRGALQLSDGNEFVHAFSSSMISVEEARRAVLETARLCPSECIPFRSALGRTLSTPLESREHIPPFPNSAMDGFAVRVSDMTTLPVTLKILEDLPAGAVPTYTLTTGTCARIMTGAMLPEGADAVVPVEWTRSEGRYVHVERAPEPGQFVRPRGKDLRPGQRVIEDGTVITPPVIGMLATLGTVEVNVRTPPRVAVISTGDELVPPHQTPGSGEIRDANGPGLGAQVQHAGGVALPLLTASDSAPSLHACLDRALRAEAEVLVFSGGVSMGTKDLVEDVLRAHGFERRFWRVRQRPGKPLLFGLLQEKPVFGLPGNPVSSAVCFEQYVRPLLAAMLGRRELVRPLFPALLETPVEKAAGLYHFIRASAHFGEDGRLRVLPTGAQDSNLYSSMLHAHGFIHLPEHVEHPVAGTAVAFEWLHW